MVLKVNMYVTNSFQMLDSIQFTTDSWVHKKKKQHITNNAHHGSL